MLRTNSKQVREAIKRHIIDSITDEEGNQLNTFEAAAKRLTSEFKRVADHAYNLRRLPNNQERFEDYLNGIPFNFYFYYHDVRQFLAKILEQDEQTASKYSDSQVMKLYFYMIWRETEKYYYNN